MNIGERVTLIRGSYANGNNQEFAKIMGATTTTTSNWCNADSLGKDVIIKLLQKFPDVDANWLLMGQGDMLKSSKTINTTLDSNQGIPLIPLSAMAGRFTGEQQILECECERYIVPAFKGADFLIHVKGDSMQPRYMSGDIVACKRVPMERLFFQWNHTYVLDTDQGALIKRIKPGTDAQHVSIVSDNEEYAPFELPVECIYGVALVMGTIRLE